MWMPLPPCAAPQGPWGRPHMACLAATHILVLWSAEGRGCRLVGLQQEGHTQSRGGAGVQEERCRGGCLQCSRQEESRQRPRHTAHSTRGGPTAPSPKQQGVGTGVSGEGTGLGRAGGEQTCRPPWSHRVRPPAVSVSIVSVSISNLYPGCEHVSVRSRSMMFEPGLTRGTLEVLVAPPQHPHCAADDQSTKAIDIQNAYLNAPSPPRVRLPGLPVLEGLCLCSGAFTRTPQRPDLESPVPRVPVLREKVEKSPWIFQSNCTLRISGPRVGDFSVWEFSGNPVYFCCYDYFAANDPTSIHVIVFSLEEPYEIQLNQVIFWLNFLKSLVPVEEPIAFGGKLKNPLHVVLVATHADIMNVPRPAGGEFRYDKDASLLKEIRNRFGNDLHISNKLFVLDAGASGSKDMKVLRSHLQDIRSQIISVCPPMTHLCEKIISTLPSWRKLHGPNQLMSLQQFVDDVQEQLNPLAREGDLRRIAQQLHSAGEINIMQSETVQDVLLLDPRWLCTNVLGKLLSVETPRALHHYRGRYTVEDVQRLVPDSDVEELLQILDAMDICARDLSSGTMVDIPALIKTDNLHRSWTDEEDEGRVYGGVRIVPVEYLTPFPCGIFYKVQVNLCRWIHQQSAEGDADIRLWVNGCKIANRGAELLVLLVNHGQGIEVQVRGLETEKIKCCLLLDSVCSTMENVMATTLPGLLTVKHYLSPQQLREHHEPVMIYQPRDFFRAQTLKETSLTNTMGGYKESFSSVMCFGCHDVYSQASLGMDIHASDLNLLTRRKLCRLLDPPDPMGKDWCLLAMNLGLPDLVAKYNTNNGTPKDFLPSPVHALLREWASYPESTVGILMSKLRELGRRDAADFLLKASSVFKINLDGSGQEAYDSSCNSGTSYNSISSVVSRREETRTQLPFCSHSETQMAQGPGSHKDEPHGICLGVAGKGTWEQAPHPLWAALPSVQSPLLGCPVVPDVSMWTGASQGLKPLWAELEATVGVPLGSEICIPHLGKGIRAVGGNPGREFAEQDRITAAGLPELMKRIVPTVS
ncbi:hypothetical protein PANDA_009083 [Ailuropoda melanoleuca]|uniref:Death associated protein kinase 1 n=1 Tax=Ailuropoda melanoleuca TaxID=9646 RepID=D2HE82_AILME|nr:hypothetical protein PANDA_009083 [Ailuropoda melanoleuca]